MQSRLLQGLNLVHCQRLHVLVVIYELVCRLRVLCYARSGYGHMNSARFVPTSCIGRGGSTLSFFSTISYVSPYGCPASSLLGKDPNFPRCIVLCRGQTSSPGPGKTHAHALFSSLMVRMSPLGILRSTVCPIWIVSSRELMDAW